MTFFKLASLSPESLAYLNPDNIPAVVGGALKSVAPKFLYKSSSETGVIFESSADVSLVEAVDCFGISSPNAFMRCSYVAFL